MRLLEIASAEEQIALFKLVSDSVWQALTSQQKQQADERAAKQAADKLKPKTGLKNKLRNKANLPQLPMPKPAQPQQQVQQKQVVQQPQSFVQNASKPTQIDPVTAAAQNNRGYGRQT